MGFVTTTILALGVVISALCGMVCYLGASAVADALDSLPFSQLVLLYPQAGLGLGAILILAGIVAPPSRA